MSDHWFNLLSEAFDMFSVIEDPEFTEVSRDGEIYTRYRVVRITHEAEAHPDGWTHMANVVRVRKSALGVAVLRVADKVIEDAHVTLAPMTP